MSGKSLVTGGAGFLGAHVARELLEMGEEVLVLDDLSGGFEENVPKGAEFVRGSVADDELVDSLFDENNITRIYHLAAYAAEGLSHFIKRFNYINNLVGSVNLINAAVNHEVRCYVFTSSIAVYGSNQLPMVESLVPQPEDSYGIAKFAVEKELEASQHLFGLDYVIFRPHNVYGELQNIGDKYRNVIGIFMNNILQNKPLTVFGDGEQTRAFTYVRDIAPIIARAGFERDVYNQIFNIGADTPYTINELLKKVMEVMGKEVGIQYLTERKEVKHAYADHSKVKEAFAYEPRYSLEDGLKNMAEWVMQSGSRASQEFGNIEISKNLPDGWN